MSSLGALLATCVALTLAAALRGVRGTTLRGVRGTTLVAPLGWTVFAFSALALAELAAALSPGAAWLPHLRLLAAGTTFCPFMALLGAKRPQDRGWQFVVLSLWGVLAFYGLTELAYRPHQPPELHWVVRWLLVAPLVGMGFVNHLFTRFAVPATLVAMAQVLLLSPQLPEVRSWLPARLTVGPECHHAAALTGIVMLSSAAGLAILLARYGRPMHQDRPMHQAGRAADDVWLDFRDQFGTFWGLRVAARFNQSAVQLGWPERLSWHGFQPPKACPDDGKTQPAQPADPSLQPAACQALESLLRRFVDPDWLARRWDAAELPDGRPRQERDREDR